MRSYPQPEKILPRFSQKDLAFYDGIAKRIREVLQDSASGTTVAALALAIGWKRANLSNFLNRKTRSISTHMLARTAKVLKMPIGNLMSDDDCARQN